MRRMGVTEEPGSGTPYFVHTQHMCTSKCLQRHLAVCVPKVGGPAGRRPGKDHHLVPHPAATQGSKHTRLKPRDSNTKRGARVRGGGEQDTDPPRRREEKGIFFSLGAGVACRAARVRGSEKIQGFVPLPTRCRLRRGEERRGGTTVSTPPCSCRLHRAWRAAARKSQRVPVPRSARCRGGEPAYHVVHIRISGGLKLRRSPMRGIWAGVGASGFKGGKGELRESCGRAS